MSAYEVPEPIINSPFEEPQWHWHIEEGMPCEKRPGRRPSVYYYRPPKAGTGQSAGSDVGTPIELKLVNLIRERVKEWREAGYPGVSRTTLELLQWWKREGREQRLFFAQMEAVETIIFLKESRADLRQGIEIPRDEPSDDKKEKGYTGFARYACKMATGSGKTTVMGMLAAWSILNKQADRSDGRFSDVVFIVCPNVTIRDRLAELDPKRVEASLYRTRDLVPPHMMTALTQGHVVVTNWHVLEPQDLSGSNKVDKRGKQSDTALVGHVLQEAGGKQNILVLNDEAHHAYRIRQEQPDEFEEDVFGEKEEAEAQVKEATVWIEGLDKIQKLRGINFCVDLSATPYFLNRVGQDANRPFPWVVSDFGLVDSIESGLVKIPQLAIRDTTGAEIPAYFNIWRWIMEPGRLTPAERGGSKAQPKPEAILKHAHTPIAMLGGLWQEKFEEWQAQPNEHSTPPVFILVCKTTKLAKMIYEWLAEDKKPAGIPPSKLEWFRNQNGQINTIRVDSKVVHDTDTGEAKDDEKRWMRFTLDTVGKTQWTPDSQGRPQYPPDFVDVANKLKRPLHPPGRDVRCIVSVGMLTEGWDCHTVTHIVGLRPFMSQLLCEQVVGRGLRRTSYDVGENNMLSEEVAKVFGVPFEVIPFKTNPKGTYTPPPKRWHVHPIPQKEDLKIKFPRVEGYAQAIRNRVAVRNWASIPSLTLEPGKIPPEVQVKGLNVNTWGKQSLHGPGKIDDVTLAEFRARRRLQELEFDLGRDLTQQCLSVGQCHIPAHALFPQIRAIVHRYLKEKVRALPGTHVKDVFLSPYYGWLIEILSQEIAPDTSQGEEPEVPRYEANRGPGSTRDVDFWTSRDVREIERSHLNYAVLDTKKWEQTAAYYLDKNPNVLAFAKNAGLGFAIPYMHNGQMHDYLPDFLVRLQSDGKEVGNLILETKGYDPLEEVKIAAAQRWVEAVNADGQYGRWAYQIARKMTDIERIVKEEAEGV